MQNEFYRVEADYDSYYFKDKDKAFAFLWQKFLVRCGDAPDEYIKQAFEELNEAYMIDSFGSIQVCGFED